MRLKPNKHFVLFHVSLHVYILYSYQRTLELCVLGLRIIVLIIEPGHEKTCLRGLRLVETQTGLLSYRD